MVSTSAYAQGLPTGPTPNAVPSETNAVSGPSTGLEQLDLTLLLNPEIQSASLIAERVSEAPAPVTVITSQMIEAIGARNLQEVLITYVPGMTLVTDQNERNVAMRGVYTSSQQKILVLLNGHRLNSRTFSSADPDFSIGIQPSKIKQIEVVRGPGSSVYGNLALNGIINIVTKSPGSVSGVHANVGTGTFGQVTGSLTYGQQITRDQEILVWGSFFRSDGQRLQLDPSADEPRQVYNKHADSMDSAEALLMRYDDPPSFDVGMQYGFDEFSAMAMVRQGKYSEPFTAGGANTGEAYNYEDYRAWEGVGPGFYSRSGHFEASWERELSERLSFKTSGYFDANQTQQHLVKDPSSQLHSNIGWSETSLGNITQLTTTYDGNWFGTGSLVLGGQIDRMNLEDSQWITGDQGDWRAVSDSLDEPTLPKGSETSYSAFTQLKHKFNDQIIYNLGVRYDYKDRLRGENLSAVSPRTALILGADAPVGVKFSFAESFVDAAYWYRYNSVPNFRGTPDLLPERMRAFQLSPQVRLLDGKLQNTVNLYYANHFDVIFRNKQALNTPDEPLYQNSGTLTVAGVENEFAYLERSWRLRTNLAFQRPLFAENYPASTNIGEIHNVPKFSANVIFDFKPLKDSTEDIWMSFSGRYYGEQLSPIQIRYTIPQGRHEVVTVNYDEPDRIVDDYILLNSSVRWKKMFDSKFSTQLVAHNLLDTSYLQGGTTSHPIPQPGRWFLLQLGYSLDL